MREEFAAWQARARELRARADRVADAVIHRARRIARAAGLDPEMPFLHAHNAVVAASQGSPWPDVEYDLAHRVLALERLSWEPHRVLDRWHSRCPPP